MAEVNTMAGGHEYSAHPPVMPTHLQLALISTYLNAWSQQTAYVFTPISSIAGSSRLQKLDLALWSIYQAAGLDLLDECGRDDHSCSKVARK